jgi:RNA polymerase sigma-70 factor (ECF subfamily)
MTPNDGIADLKSAERRALALLLEEHRQRLLGMLRGRLTGRLAARKDADDLVAEVYLVAQRKWRAFQAQGEVSAWVWLYGIARDCLSETWARETCARRDVRDEREFPDRSSEQLALGLMASVVSPSSAAARKESKEKVQVALGRLKPADHEILVMRHYDQLSFKDAAQVLGITQNAANVRYVRALDRLREHLQDLGLDPRCDL